MHIIFHYDLLLVIFNVLRMYSLELRIGANDFKNFGFP